MSQTERAGAGFGRGFTATAVIATGLLAWSVAGCGSSTDTGDGKPDGGGNSGSGAAASSGDLGIDAAVPGSGCTNVDILFVIDNSPSMKPWQEGLAAAFPTFIDEMYKRLPARSLHVGTTTTSFWQGECGESFKDCQTLATKDEILAHYMKPSDGSTGANGEQGRLFNYDGKAFFDTNTSDATGEPALKQWFSEAAVAAGEMGCSFEMPVAAAGYVGNPVNNATNQGFLRDDKSLYLIFILSDEVDKSPEGLDVYKKMVTDAKAKCGGEVCVLGGGLVDPCVMAGQDTAGISQFLNGFAGKKAILGSIKEPDKYTDVVGTGLAEAVKNACADIEPTK